MVISSIYRILEMKNMTIKMETIASAVIMIATRDVMVMMMIIAHISLLWSNG